MNGFRMTPVTDRLPARCFLKERKRLRRWAVTPTGLGICHEETAGKLLSTPPYSPDISADDSYLFRPLEKRLAKKPLAQDADVKQAITSWLHTLDTDFFCARTQALVPQRKIGLNRCRLRGVWCAPSAIRVLCTHGSQNKVLCIRFKYETPFHTQTVESIAYNFNWMSRICTPLTC